MGQKQAILYKHILTSKKSVIKMQSLLITDPKLMSQQNI